jgi:hypothetical protein
LDQKNRGCPRSRFWDLGYSEAGKQSFVSGFFYQGFVSGHGFSRAENGLKMKRALAGCFSPALTLISIRQTRPGPCGILTELDVFFLTHQPEIAES